MHNPRTVPNSVRTRCSSSQERVSNRLLRTHVHVTGFTGGMGTGHVIVATSTLLYFGYDQLTAEGGLYRATSATGLSTGPWTVTVWPGATGAFQPRNPTAAISGVHGLTGRFEAGVYTIYLTTAGATANSLYQYVTTADTSSVLGAGYTLLATAPATVT